MNKIKSAITPDEYEKRKIFLKRVASNSEQIFRHKVRIKYSAPPVNRVSPNDYGNGENFSFIKGRLNIYNSWGDFIEDERIKYRLYYTIGHELGHGDNEPTFLILPVLILLASLVIAIINIVCIGLFRRLGIVQSYYGAMRVVTVVALLLFVVFAIKYILSTKAGYSAKDSVCRRSMLRELRADYIGVLFAMEYLRLFEPSSRISREELIRYSFPEYMDNERAYNHPSNSERREWLLNYPEWNEETVRKVCEEYSYTDKETREMLKMAFRGTLLQLQETVRK